MKPPRVNLIKDFCNTPWAAGSWGHVQSECVRWASFPLKQVVAFVSSFIIKHRGGWDFWMPVGVYQENVESRAHNLCERPKCTGIFLHKNFWNENKRRKTEKAQSRESYALVPHSGPLTNQVCALFDEEEKERKIWTLVTVVDAGVKNAWKLKKFRCPCLFKNRKYLNIKLKMSRYNMKTENENRLIFWICVYYYVSSVYCN